MHDPFSKLISEKPILLDVRSPSEYQQGHIPGAISFPLFSDQERHEVGLAYKTKGSHEAVKTGLAFVAPKMLEMVKQAETLAPDRKLHLYCWRGGMRSSSVAWLLRTAGFEVTCIPGGYKTWRNFALRLFEKPLALVCLGGYTGVGKTPMLHTLEAKGEQILDLESIANHRGSAFGTMGEQPTTEQFENLVAASILRLDPQKTTWIEDESRRIGKVFVPHSLLAQMNRAPHVSITKTTEERIKEVCQLYGAESKEGLIASFKKIEKRMGGQFCKAAIGHVASGDLESAARLALNYYDKSYLHSLTVRKVQPVFSIQTTNSGTTETADSLIRWKNQNLPNTATAQAAGAK